MKNKLWYPDTNLVWLHSIILYILELKYMAISLKHVIFNCFYSSLEKIRKGKKNCVAKCRVQIAFQIYIFQLFVYYV